MMDATRIGKRGTVPIRPATALVAIGVGVLFGVESAPAAQLPQTPAGHDSVLVESRPERRALRAMVAHDPDDRRSAHGYFRVAEVYSARMLEPNIRRLMVDGTGSLLQNPHALQNLVCALNEYTDIDAEVSSRHPFSARELMEVPWIFVNRLTTTLSGMELTNLGRYLASGGFVLADAGAAVGRSEDVFIRHSIREALASAGLQTRFRRLPATHPIYHSYFDFEGPPRAILGGVGAGSGAAGAGRNNVDYIVGVEVGDRLAVVITYQNLGSAWENAPPRNETSGFADNSRHLQFGINTIVYALTQKGSITQKAMGQVP